MNRVVAFGDLNGQRGVFKYGGKKAGTYVPNQLLTFFNLMDHSWENLGVIPGMSTVAKGAMHVTQSHIYIIPEANVSKMIVAQKNALPLQWVENPKSLFELKWRPKHCKKKKIIAKYKFAPRKF